VISNDGNLIIFWICAGRLV